MTEFVAVLIAAALFAGFGLLGTLRALGSCGCGEPSDCGSCPGGRSREEVCRD